MNDPALTEAPLAEETLTVGQSVARGKAARRRVSRPAQAWWMPPADRPDPIASLVEQGESRLPDLLPTRHARMAVSPFSFFRGAALIMARDLAASPTTGFTVQLCGDAHLDNFGVFASPERQLMFDINDFDETLPGPWEWDVKRLAASFEIAGRDRGFDAADRRAIVLAGVEEYRREMVRAARRGVLDTWYAHIEEREIKDIVAREVARGRLSRKDASRILRDIAKARTRDSARAFSRRVGNVGGELRFIPQPPLIIPIEDLLPLGRERAASERAMARLLGAYRRSLAPEHHPIEEFTYVHLALNVVGVGSVGTRCWLMLLAGRDTDDALILQAKEAQPSVLERFLPASRFANHGQRVVAGQRSMQASTDIFLGWKRVVDLDRVRRDYYVRQFHDWKGALDVQTMRVPAAMLYSELCGATLARAHARWGDRIAIAAYLGSSDAFDRAIAGFASTYAEQNERDYEAFLSAIASGRIEASETAFA